MRSSAMARSWLSRMTESAVRFCWGLYGVTAPLLACSIHPARNSDLFGFSRFALTSLHLVVAILRVIPWRARP